MDVVEDCLAKIINSDNFPAKLWRLVNNPVNEAIFWDKDGLVVVIDQILFEQQVLSPRNSSSASNNADTFQTANFTSFLRNLNLYGFKKSDTYDDVKYRYYYHPNFKRDHPELVASLVRLTVVNKAKLEAGLQVKPWTVRRYHRYRRGCGGGDKDGQIGNHSLPSTPHRKSAHPYCPNKAPAVTAHNGTPVPPRFLTWGRGAALSPTVFATDKGIPMTLSQHYAGAASSSNNFPAKLWRLVNNPVNEAIFWDKDGLVVVIDQILVEQQVLFPRNSSSASNTADTFQTANFSSFLRNLHLYGFKTSDIYDDVQYRYYYQPNFKRDHPELVASLVRLTVVNKAKLEAGLQVKPWTVRRYHRYRRGCGGGDKDGQIGNHSLPSTPHRKSAHPYCPNKAPAVTAHNGTPVPPRFLTWGRGAALSPTAFATDKGIPMTLSQHYAGAASSSNNFPAKLWRLVNNPVNEAIFWDKDGLVVVIDQILVEQQVLFPRNSSSASNNADTFQTANFSSFLRNLHLYGFKKSDIYDDVQYRYYYQPNFKRDHPELVASLVRLTVVNKAKLEAGLKVKPWTPRRYHRYSGGCGGGDQDGQIVGY